MWVLLALTSALLLGVYDIFKKISVNGNNVLTVLSLNTLFGALLLSPIIGYDIVSGDYGFEGNFISHLKIILKSIIVLSAWVLGYFGIKHLPLTLAGPISATRPVLVLIGAMLIFGEKLNAYQWLGVFLGFISLFLINRIGGKEGFSVKNNKWIWYALGSTLMGAISGLYDKYLLQQFEPLQVQAWYAIYQCIIMGVAIFLIKKYSKSPATPFVWRWSIPCIALFLTLADLAYFYALSIDDAMISIVSMVRRGSIIIPFLFGVFILKEKNIRLKIIDLSILLLGLIMLIIGSQ